MNHFTTIFRKEFTDTIRDRRTLFVMVIFPLVLVPLLLFVVTKLRASSLASQPSRAPGLQHREIRGLRTSVPD
jgi:ABC-type Na+ efflux pump permease subunit